MVVSSFCYGFCDDDVGLAVDMEFIEAEKETKGEPDEIILSLGHTRIPGHILRPVYMFGSVNACRIPTSIAGGILFYSSPKQGIAIATCGTVLPSYSAKYKLKYTAILSHRVSLIPVFTKFGSQ